MVKVLFPLQRTATKCVALQNSQKMCDQNCKANWSPPAKEVSWSSVNWLFLRKPVKNSSWPLKAIPYGVTIDQIPAHICASNVQGRMSQESSRWQPITALMQLVATLGFTTRRALLKGMRGPKNIFMQNWKSFSSLV